MKATIVFPLRQTKKYFYSFRDVVSWAIANGFKWYRSSALNYDHSAQYRDSLQCLVHHSTTPISTTT